MKPLISILIIMTCTASHAQESVPADAARPASGESQNIQPQPETPSQPVQPGQEPSSGQSENQPSAVQPEMPPASSQNEKPAPGQEAAAPSPVPSDKAEEQPNFQKYKTPLTFSLDLYGGYALVFGSESDSQIIDFDDDNETSHEMYQNGCLAGLRFGITFPNTILIKFHVFAGLEYYYKTFTAKVSDEKTIDDGDWFSFYDDEVFDARYSVRLHYINLIFGFRMSVKWFFVETGGYGGFALREYDEITSIRSSGDITSRQIRDGFRAQDDFGILLGIGAAIPVHTHITLTVGIRADVGLLTTTRVSHLTGSSTVAAALYAGVGFRI